MNDFLSILRQRWLEWVFWLISFYIFYLGVTQ